MIFGTGIDIVEVGRIERAIDRWGDHFLKYVFCDEEIAYSQSQKFPAQHFAVRFAAKEAVFKAIGDPTVGWKDLSILNDKNGKPYCVFKRVDFKNSILISLSHSRQYAVANAIITKGS